MILYFSGTGNSKFVADYLSDKLNDECRSLNDYLKNGQKLICHSDIPYIVVAPIYAWRIPLIIEELLKKSDLSGCSDVYAVVTMGENSGNADKYLEKIFADKGMNFKGYIGVPMQNNYLLMEKMPDITTINDQLKSVISKLEHVYNAIYNKTPLKKDDKTPLPALMSGLINWGFNNFMLKNQSFTVNEKCTVCQKCVQVCPVNNISLKTDNIVFDKNCMACFACLHNCPVEAINVEGKTEDKGRYICPDYNNFK